VLTRVDVVMVNSDPTGWDATAVGARVVTFNGAGGWAQRRVAASSNVAVLPDSVDFVSAAALPVAGVTARWDLSST